MKSDFRLEGNPGSNPRNTGSRRSGKRSLISTKSGEKGKKGMSDFKKEKKIMSDFRFRVEEMSDLKNAGKTDQRSELEIRRGCGPTPVARGGCRAKAPPLAARPKRGLHLPWEEVPPDETPGLMTLHAHNTNVLQSITHAKSPYPPDRSNLGHKI